MELSMYLTKKKTNPSIKTKIIENNVYINVYDENGKNVLSDLKKLGFWRDHNNLENIRSAIVNVIECDTASSESLSCEYGKSLSKIYDPKVIPEEFMIEDDVLYSVKSVRNQELIDLICYTAPWVSQIYSNPDTSYKMLDISFYNSKDEITTVTLPQENCFEKRGVQKINSHGALLAESKAKQMIDWLTAYIHFNDIPQTQIFSQFGWKSNNSFLVGNRLYTSNGVQSAKVINIPLKNIQGFGQKGSIEKWLDMTEPLLKYPMSRFKCYASCAAPLLNMLHQSSMVVHDYGESQSGKTITAKLAMSIWGNPDDLLISNYSTKVGKEILLGINTDLPVFIDEMQVSGAEENKEIIYMIANGVGRVRSTKELILQDIKHWNTVALMTGEAPLTDDSSFKGVTSRVLEIYGGLGIKNKVTLSAIEQYSSGVIDNYGVFAPYVIEEIRNHPEDVTDTYEFLYKKYKELSDDLNESEKGVGGRASAMFSIITLGGSIFETIMQRLDRPAIDSQKIAHKIFESYISDLNDSGYSMKAYNHFMSWFNTKQKYFLADEMEKGSRTPYEVFGNETDEYIDIFPNVFNKVMAELDFNKKRICEDWKREGLLDVTSGRNQKRVRWGNEVKYVYRILKQNPGINLNDQDKDYLF